ncbi:MAG: hypothetical protein V1758_01445 [Pseudomonadota bacterium]
MTFRDGTIMSNPIKLQPGMIAVPSLKIKLGLMRFDLETSL